MFKTWIHKQWMKTFKCFSLCKNIISMNVSLSGLPMGILLSLDTSNACQRYSQNHSRCGSNCKNILVKYSSVVATSTSCKLAILLDTIGPQYLTTQANILVTYVPYIAQIYNRKIYLILIRLPFRECMFTWLCKTIFTTQGLHFKHS